MQPHYQLETQSGFIDEQAKLISISIVDKAGFDSDSMTLVFDDTDYELVIPTKGEKIKASLGYVETGLTLIGEFVVDDINLNGPPNRMTVRCKGADLRESLRAPKTRSWHQIKLADLINTIASEHQLTAKISKQFQNEMINHIEQTVSDIHFLTSLAKDRDAIAKPAGQYLLFTEKGKGKSVSGQSLPTISLSNVDISSYDLSLPDRNRYKSVQAFWRDTENAVDVPVTVGEGDSAYKIRKPYKTENEAVQAAQAKFSSLKRSGSKLNLSLIRGLPAIGAETPINVSGIRNGVNGEWIVSEVNHRFNNGYHMSLACEAAQ